MPESNKFKSLVEKASSIIVVSHFSPDPDAVSSVLLLGTTLKKNFPDKQVDMVIEEKPARSLDFLSGFDQIKFQPIIEVIDELRPDLFVIVDAMNYERLSRKDAEKIRQSLKASGAKLAIIDHHEEVDVEPHDLYINKKNPATAQELYEILFEDLKLEKSDGYAATTLLGIISDTARHKYFNPRHRQTFKIVSELIDSGASVEELESKLDRFTSDQLEVLNELLGNIKDSGKGYTYSFIDDPFTQNWLAKNKSIDEFKMGFEEFSNMYLRNFENNLWGFAVYSDLAGGDNNVYGVSFRSVAGAKDVAQLANQLGGGGHKPAAGAKIKADNVQDAIQQVTDVIEASE